MTHSVTNTSALLFPADAFIVVQQVALDAESMNALTAYKYLLSFSVLI